MKSTTRSVFGLLVVLAWLFLTARSWLVPLAGPLAAADLRGWAVGMLAVHWYMRSRRLEDVVARAPWWLTGLVWAGMLFLIVITQGSGDAFIYFQF